MRSPLILSVLVLSTLIALSACSSPGTGTAPGGDSTPGPDAPLADCAPIAEAVGAVQSEGLQVDEVDLASLALPSGVEMAPPTCVIAITSPDVAGAHGAFVFYLSSDGEWDHLQDQLQSAGFDSSGSSWSGTDDLGLFTFTGGAISQMVPGIDDEGEVVVISFTPAE